jgi:hypothetical protein
VGGYDRLGKDKEDKKGFKILVGKPLENRLLVIPRRSRGGNHYDSVT